MRRAGVPRFVVLALLGAVSCRFEGEGADIVVTGRDPVAYAKRTMAALGDPADSATFAVGGDLYVRDISSPTAAEINVTGRLTRGAGDVADPEPSYDGRRIVFAMRCTQDSSPECSADTTWNIWEYDLVDQALTRIIADDFIANLGDDVDPVYLPDGRIVFSSTRQKTTQGRYGQVYRNNQGEPYSVLHVMNADGTGIEQISFNQGNDRNPAILADGRIVFARRDRFGGLNKISIYTVRPDGSDMQVLYGAHSPGESFLHPRELAPGRIISTVMPLRGTWEGGALLDIDTENFADADDRAPGVAATQTGQKPATDREIPLGHAASQYGRYTAPFPINDGTMRVLVSFSPYVESIQTNAVNGTETTVEAPPQYGIYMLDVATKSMKPLVLPTAGYAYLDPVALVPRPAPRQLVPVVVDTGMFQDAAEDGAIAVASVYDSDGFGRMDNALLTTSERAVKAIPMVQPADPGRDTRDLVADLARLKDPALTTAGQRAARFVRVTRAIPLPLELSPAVVGATPYQMRHIVGYAPIEPDGSLVVRVPADAPISLSVLDDQGRAYDDHLNWMQVRPGEVLACDGCHAPRRIGPLNVAPVAGNHPNTRLLDAATRLPLLDPQTRLPVTPLADETMAQTRVRADRNALTLQRDLVYVDVWTDPAAAGRAADAAVTVSYDGLTTPAPVQGIINYPEHIQPLWDKDRPATSGGIAVNNRCTNCHNGVHKHQRNPTGLDLRGTLLASTGRSPSYEDLLAGDFVFDNGRPIYDIVDGLPVARRKPPLAMPGAARRSFLVEQLYGQELFAEMTLRSSGIDHSEMLTAAEKRLVTEWIDVGAQYYNDPYNTDGSVREVGPRLSLSIFVQQVSPILAIRCADCHMPIFRNGVLNPAFQPSQFVLPTPDDRDANFNAAGAMVTDVMNPANSALLARPTSTLTHPAFNGAPILDLTQADDLADYDRLYDWIAAAR